MSRPCRHHVAVVALGLLAALGCADADPTTPTASSTTPSAVATSTPPAARPAPLEDAPATPAPTPTTSPTGSEDPTAGASPTPDATIVSLRVESRVEDVSTEELRSEVEAVLTDPRGWRRAGFRFVFDQPVPPYRLVLAEGWEVDELCHPLDTGATYSCQNGPVVALNADRWRGGTSEWTSTIEAYRQMLVNHEVGHLLHLHHPLPQCPGAGLPAPVMAQQSTELGLCTANPWPLQWEVDLAAEKREPLAPPAEHDTRDHQPSPPPATE